jgi:hypothetical protein
VIALAAIGAQIHGSIMSTRVKSTIVPIVR